MTRSTIWIVPLVLCMAHAATAQTHDGPPRRRSAAATKMLAEERGETPEVQALVAGQDANARDTPKQRTALMWSIIRNDQASVQRFMNANPDVNAVDDRGATALAIAVEAALTYDTAPIVIALIGKGATTAGGIGPGGMTLLMMAANANSPAIASALLQRGKSAIDAPGPDGATALGIAASMGARDVVYLLLENGAGIDRVDFTGKTALIRSAGHRFPGTPETVKLLLEMGASPAARDKDGNTALSEAVQRGPAEVVELLKKAGVQ